MYDNENEWTRIDAEINKEEKRLGTSAQPFLFTSPINHSGDACGDVWSEWHPIRRKLSLLEDRTMENFLQEIISNDKSLLPLMTLPTL